MAKYGFFWKFGVTSIEYVCLNKFKNKNKYRENTIFWTFDISKGYFYRNTEKITLNITFTLPEDVWPVVHDY